MPELTPLFATLALVLAVVALALVTVLSMDRWRRRRR